MYQAIMLMLCAKSVREIHPLHERLMRGLYRICYVLVLILAVVPAVFRGWRMPAGRLDPETVQTGQVLFHHDWYPGDPLAAGGDGLGPVFNAKSCVACHQQGGAGGSGGLQHNVILFTIAPDKPGEAAREGVIHKAAIAPEFEEKLNQVSGGIRSEEPGSETVILPQFGARTQALISQRNTPALFGARLIDRLPERILLSQERLERMRQSSTKSKDEEAPVGRALRLPNGRLGRFGWKAQTASLSDFVQAACANELGLGNPGQAQPQPLGQPDYQPPGLDLTQEQCDQLTAFCASLPRPKERLPQWPEAREQARAGKALFTKIGCADCHTPNLGPITGIYSDLLLHKMGERLSGRGSYNRPIHVPADSPPAEAGPGPDEWRTPPLWGVRDSAPYLHDGRAATLEDAIRLHGGQGSSAARAFELLNNPEQAELMAFLNTLQAP
jgi:CxxC motif-containing protein (DUF1111 family)